MKKQTVKKIYRASVRVRFRYEFFCNTFYFEDRTVYRDYSFDPRGFSFGLKPWLDEIKEEHHSTFVKFLTSPEVEEIEVNEQ